MDSRREAKKGSEMFAESFFDEMEKIAVGSGGTPALLGTPYEPQQVQARIDPVRHMTAALFSKGKGRYGSPQTLQRRDAQLPASTGKNWRRQADAAKAIAPVRSSTLPPGHMNFR